MTNLTSLPATNRATCHHADCYCDSEIGRVISVHWNVAGTEAVAGEVFEIYGANREDTYEIVTSVYGTAEHVAWTVDPFGGAEGPGLYSVDGVCSGYATLAEVADAMAELFA